MISFVLAAGHYVAGVMLTTHSNSTKWYLALANVMFVNEDDPEKIINAMTASSVSLHNFVRN